MNDQTHQDTNLIHEPQLNETIDGFYLKELLSERAVNNLFLVTHPDHNFPMIMKVPRLGAMLPASAFTEFETEMRILSSLHGAYTPKIIAQGAMATCPYFVMEYIEGDNLMQAIEQAPVTNEKLIKMMVPVCKSLHKLHRHNIIHLDIKPNNIRNRPDGGAVIIDFGTAHHAHLPDQYNDPNKNAPRSFDYVAPEQIHHIRTDSRSDVYAIGVILYQLATGELPFGKANHITVNKRLYLPPTPPRAINDSVPAWLQEIILKCLERRPENRFLSAKQVAFSLSHPELVVKNKRSELTKKPDVFQMVGYWLHSRRDDFHQTPEILPHERISSAPHVLIALDLDNTPDDLQQALRYTIRRMTELDKMSFFTVITVVGKSGSSEIEDYSEVVKMKYPTHVQRQMELRHWMAPLNIPDSQINFQVIEGDAAHEIIDYSKYHIIDRVVIGARGSSTLRRFIGSVSTRVVAEVSCSVIVVRTQRETVNSPDVTADE